MVPGVQGKGVGEVDGDGCCVRAAPSPGAGMERWGGLKAAVAAAAVVGAGLLAEDTWLGNASSSSSSSESTIM